MIFNGTVILMLAFAGALSTIVAWYFAEEHFKHELQHIKLINTAHIEASMREDGWTIAPVDTDDVYDYDKDC